MAYEELDIDPTAMTKPIEATQFEIRAEQFEKTCLNLLDRIITSAGYSPQSFGLNIAGRAESGTACAEEFKRIFDTSKISVVLTAEASGIPLATICAEKFGVPLMVLAPATALRGSEARSPTWISSV